MEERRWVGIDGGKRTMEVRIIDGHSKVLAWNGKTDGKGRTRLAELVRSNDLVGIEAGVLGFAIAKDLRRVGTEVLILNPGMLAVIYATMKRLMPRTRSNWHDWSSDSVRMNCRW